ncbi:5-azacytidine-induced protein 2 isoform X3 [Mus pahari]|uniref:5-azacytidine-induced protein 2 isoform X3 n=1 Tax=Mus pahari TaxID=10093 RepID=UPI001114CB97|nr:5-azacytidine-induced protein 2 isoform X3 [Mus pahari]
MDTLVEDDICILNHEKAHRREAVTPLSAYPGDESVASHFALVTAYEDIKKRLKDSEKENSFLKKRIRALEEKLVGARADEETSSVGREQVNKAYHAYREVCIDRDNLKNKLEKINKDNSESLRMLNEQLQSKEVELLQLRTEVETQQVMRNLNPPSSNWEVEKLSCDLKIHGLEQELGLLRKECSALRTELQKARQTGSNKATPPNPLWFYQLQTKPSNNEPVGTIPIPIPPQGPSQEDILQDRDVIRPSLSREEHVPHQGLHHSDNMQHAYWELKREMSNLHLVTQVQAELLRKLKTSAAVKKGHLI